MKLPRILKLHPTARLPHAKCCTVIFIGLDTFPIYGATASKDIVWCGNSVVSAIGLVLTMAPTSTTTY